jgi:oligopeptide transport system substrate-binding protein
MTYFGMFLSGATMNYGEWANPKYDELIKKARTMVGQERFNVLYEADKILMDDMPVIPLYYYTHPIMVKEKVKGWELTTRTTWYFGRADIAE